MRDHVIPPRPITNNFYFVFLFFGEGGREERRPKKEVLTPCRFVASRKAPFVDPPRLKVVPLMRYRLLPALSALSFFFFFFGAREILESNKKKGGRKRGETEIVCGEDVPKYTTSQRSESSGRVVDTSSVFASSFVLSLFVYFFLLFLFFSLSSFGLHYFLLIIISFAPCLSQSWKGNTDLSWPRCPS